MEIARTPDDRFTDLEGYAFAPHYTDLGDVRMHRVDEGAGEPVLLLHGEPTWSYLYRTMIPVLTGAGLRAVAPDLIGFGRSDKPLDPAAYTYQSHVDWTWALIESLGLDGITLVGQDWGSLIGLRLVAEHPDRFARVVMANGFLPTGDVAPPPAWFAFRDATISAEIFDVPRFVQAGCVTTLSPQVRAGYDAPFPAEEYKVAARRFPQLVPATPDDPATIPNRAAWEVLSKFDKPFLTAFSDQDKIFRGVDRFLHAGIPGCAGQPHTTIEGAGHFVQEDKGPELAAVVASFVAANPA